MAKTLKQFIAENAQEQVTEERVEGVVHAHKIDPETWESNIPTSLVKRHPKGEFTFYKGFYYRDPVRDTTEAYTKQVSDHLNKIGIEHEVVSTNLENFKPFRGGAPVHKQNHVSVRVKILPNQKVHVDEDGAITKPLAEQVTESRVVKHTVTFDRDGDDHYKVAKADGGGRFKLGDRVHENDLPWDEPDTEVAHKGPARVQFTFTAGDQKNTKKAGYIGRKSFRI